MGICIIISIIIDNNSIPIGTYLYIHDKFL